MELYYSLGFIYLKLTGIGEHISGEQGKKCLKNCSQSHTFGWIGYAGVRMASYCTKQ
jgi:hypothetical protein